MESDWVESIIAGIVGSWRYMTADRLDESSLQKLGIPVVNLNGLAFVGLGY